MRWTGAKRAKVVRFHRQRDHRQWAGGMITVERRWLGDIKATGRRVRRIVKPESKVERIGWLQHSAAGSDGIGIKSENLIEQNGLDLHSGGAILIAAQVGLVPREAKALEAGDRRGTAVERATLHVEHVKIEIRFQPLHNEGRRVVEAAAFDLDAGNRRGGTAAQAGQKCWIRL